MTILADTLVVIVLSFIALSAIAFVLIQVAGLILCMLEDDYDDYDDCDDFMN